MKYAMEFLKIRNRADKPRSTGLTLCRDPGHGVRLLELMLESAAPYVDYLKFRNVTSRLWSEEMFEQKIALAKKYDIKPFPGGIYGEMAFLQGTWEKAVDYLQEAGGNAFELSENYVTYTSEQKRDMLRRLDEKGFDVLFEWGRKTPNTPFDPAVAADQINEVLAAGASKIILEEGELDAVLGKDAKSGHAAKLDELFDRAGIENIILEATEPAQLKWLLMNYGSNVNLGPNLLLEQVLWIESDRRGLGRRVDWFAMDEWLEKAGLPKNRD